MLSDTTMVALAYCAASCDLHFRMLGWNGRGKRKGSGRYPRFPTVPYCRKLMGYVTWRTIIWPIVELVIRIHIRRREDSQSRRFRRCEKLSVAFAFNMFNTISHNLKVIKYFGYPFLLIMTYRKPIFHFNLFSQEEMRLGVAKRTYTAKGG